MEAIILAGGFGTRMRPLTYTRPKPLLPLLHRPLLQHILDRMPRSVKTVLFPVNYLWQQIEAYFEEHPDPRVVLVEEAEPLGTGGAIKNCARHLTGPFFVYNGDVVASIGLSQLQAFHEKRRALATISLWPVEEPWHFGVAELGPDDRIRRFVEKPKKGTAPSNLINAGHYLLNLEALDGIPGGKFSSIEREQFQPWAAAGRPLFGFRFEGYWIDCGRPEALLEAHATVLRAAGETHAVAASSTISPEAQVLGYAVGEECKIEAGSRVERSVLMDGVRLGRSVHVVDSILGEGVEVEDGARLERSVVGDFGIVAAGSRIADQRVGLRAEDLEAT